MKHELHRLRPVFDGAKYVGVLLHTAKGWTAYDQHDRPVGTTSISPSQTRQSPGCARWPRARREG